MTRAHKIIEAKAGGPRQLATRPLLLLLLVELLVSIGLGQIGHVDSHRMANAYLEWRQNPTPETRQAFERERRTAELVRWGFSGVVFAVLAGVTVFVYWMKSSAQAATHDSQLTGQLPASPDNHSSDSQRTSSS